MQAENSALQGLVVDLAANKAEARAKLAQLKDKYEHLLRGVSQSFKPCLIRGNPAPLEEAARILKKLPLAKLCCMAVRMATLG